MDNYKRVLKDVYCFGTYHNDRTGVGTRRMFGKMLTFDLREGFPVLTLRKTPWKSAIAEMIGFVNGYNTATQFEELGCKFWRANAEAWTGIEANGDNLGRIYGVQARSWNGDHDQLRNVLNELKYNPDSRRLLVTHWMPDEFSKMALPPCHVQYQFLADKTSNTLSLKFDMRSTDLVLGAPNNIVGYAWLLTVVAKAYGYTPAKLVMTMGDCHIYTDHLPGVFEMINRDTYYLPELIVPEPNGDELTWIESLRPDDFKLVGYEHHPAIKFDMAV